MKKLLIILSLFLTSFSTLSVMPPGWYQQTLPVNDFVNDIYFVDTLTGWVVTQGHTNNNDTAYIMKTTNGGDNWNIQYVRNVNLTTVQFVNSQTGYVGGGSGSGTLYILKTTNGGNNWNQIIGTFGTGGVVEDMQFINTDTGWFCDRNTFDGGLFKTTNGGVSWNQQLNQTYKPLKIFFINKDTGWVGTNDANGRLYRTTNGGSNWNLQYTNINSAVSSIFFINSSNGWMRGGTTNGVLYTTNGGFNWNNAQGENAPFDIKFVNDSIGYAGGGNQPLRIAKSTDGGRNWGYQTAQASPNINVAILKGDTKNVWAGRQVLIHTKDGGGPIIMTGIEQVGTSIPGEFRLYQNYPNPFNPKTTIEFELKRTSDIRIEVFNIAGSTLRAVGYVKKAAGRYRYDLNAEGFSSGVYFYRLTANGNLIDTKKMLLLK